MNTYLIKTYLVVCLLLFLLVLPATFHICPNCEYISALKFLRLTNVLDSTEMFLSKKCLIKVLM